MRATQFVRRGLIAFAAIASLSVGFAGVTGAQSSGTAGFTADGDPVVLNPIPGYNYELVNTPGYGDTAILGIGLYPGSEAVVVQFTPDVSGPTVIDPVGGNVAAYP
ncbi:MAG: hypothetical protein ACRDJC_15195 [Thermomicrobiales bacterium]